MKTIYFKDRNGNRIYENVSDEVADGLKETRNAIWANDAYVNLKLGQCDGLKLGQLPVSHSLVSLSL